ncbi:sulfatase [Carboxylicivirga marina]|uniref:sulfatase n=1 Tax=Carboxylicivirga marina TaxID=2800988 RepID=UPI0025940491|nr:sulfatase [uncultured Carboxylicivirga sp.]
MDVYAKKNEKPNIVIYLVDDMGLMDTSVPFVTDATGNQVKYPLNDFYRTPNMETLAEQGVRFSQFYAHSVCSPSRVSLFNGQNSARHGVTNWINSENNNITKYGPKDWTWTGLDKSSITLPALLQNAGYKTIHIGKSHLGPIGSEGENPLNLGFDINVSGNSYGQPGSYYGEDGYGNIKGNKRRAIPHLEKYHGSNVFLTEALTLEAKKAITKAKEEDKPFFLNMAHYAVHAPFHSDPRFVSHYRNSGKSAKEQAYATLIEGIDKSLGDIVQHINNLGIGENTLLLFLGDNGSDAPIKIEGGYSSSSPLRGKKGNHWEGGMRVPFIAAWISPNDKNKLQKKWPIAKNTVQTQLGSILDLFPTICSLSGVEKPKGHILDGDNLKKQLNGKKNKRRRETFLNHFPHGQHRTNYFTSLVKSDWKVIYHYQVDEEPAYELFNLKEDPFETNNLADKEKDKLSQMIQVLSDELEDKEALYPEKNGNILEVILP